MPNPVKQQMTAQYLQTKRRRQGAGEHKTKRKPTALRHLPRSKRAKAQHVQRERGAAYVVKQLVSQKSQVTRVNRLQPLTRNPRTDRHGAFDAKERTQLDPVTAIRPRFATSKTRGCYLMRAPAIARHLPADRGERGARRRDRVSTWHCLGALGALSETRKEI